MWVWGPARPVQKIITTFQTDFFLFTAAYNSLKTWLAPAVPLLMVRFCGTTPNSTSLGKIMDENIFSSPYSISIHLSPSPSNLGRQSCRAACLCILQMDEGTIKSPSPNCRLYWCLIEFIDWRYSQSCWYFRPLL